MKIEKYQLNSLPLFKYDMPQTPLSNSHKGFLSVSTNHWTSNIHAVWNNSGLLSLLTDNSCDSLLSLSNS